MKLKAVPRSRAKTAWGLLQDVKRAILAEPKRANMWCFSIHKEPKDGGPSCGTVGCFAGWTAMLARKNAVLSYDPNTTYNAFKAKLILGDNLDYSFYNGEDCHSVFNLGSGDSCASTNPGTRAHARAVAARITRFMKVNETALKARKLADVRA